MNRKILLTTLILFSICLVPPISHAELKPPAKRPPRAAIKRPPTPQTVKATANLTDLPPQPRTTKAALPDLIVEEVKISGPSGSLKPNQQYNINVVLKNIGQFDSGAFLVELRVRLQVPSQRKDETTIISSKKVYSIPPRKTGVSQGTSTATFNYTTGDYDWAQYTFTAVADHTNHIEEFDEANNEKISIDMVVDTYRQ